MFPSALYNDADMEWNDRFMALFREAVERYLLSPHIPADRFYLPEEQQFLGTIGYQPAEMHGYVVEYAEKGAPSPSTALLIAAVRRSYFLNSMRGISGNAKPITAADLPAETEEFQEIPYLPRIIRKAEAKLYGTLAADIMYGDEKDREFLRTHGDFHLADFLQLAASVRSDRQRLVSAVLNAMRTHGSAQPAPGQETHNA